MNWQQLLAQHPRLARLLAYRSYLLPVLAGAAVPLIWLLICSRTGMAGAATSRALFFALIGGGCLFFYLVNVINQNAPGGGFNLITWLFVIILPLLTLLYEKGKTVVTAARTAQNQAATSNNGEAGEDVPAPEAEAEKEKEQEANKVPREVLMAELKDSLPPDMTHWRRIFSGGTTYTTVAKCGMELLPINTFGRSGKLTVWQTGGTEPWYNKVVQIVNEQGNAYYLNQFPRKLSTDNPDHGVWVVKTEPKQERTLEDGNSELPTTLSIAFEELKANENHPWSMLGMEENRRVTPGETLYLEYLVPPMTEWEDKDGNGKIDISDHPETVGPRLPYREELGKVAWRWSLRVVWDAIDPAVEGSPKTRYLYQSVKLSVPSPPEKWILTEKEDPRLRITIVRGTEKVEELVGVTERIVNLSAEDLVAKGQTLTGEERLHIKCSMGVLNVAILISQEEKH